MTHSTKINASEKLVKGLLLASSSMAMMAVSSVAMAQDAGGGDVVATGTRQIIQDAIVLKRDATSIVDGLSAAEIGDLPALSIGEALETITGAASHRENGGATEISIRGLGPFLSKTTFNGREATNGSGDRSVNFSQFPSELISKLAIYKTQDASQIEGGVAGLIELSTLRPLDYGKRRIQLDLKGNINPDQLDQKDTIAGDLGYRGTLSVVEQMDFDNGGRLGFSMGFQRSDISQPEQEVRSTSPTGTSHRACLADPTNVEVDPSDSNDFGRGFSNLSSSNGGSSLNGDDCEDWSGGNDSVNYDGDNSTGYDTRVGADDLDLPFVIIPNERGYRQNDTHDTRDSFFAAVQYQPNERVDINVDLEFSERIQEEDRHDIGFVNFRRNTPGVTFDSLTISDQGATSTFTTESQIEARGETYNRTEKYLGGGFAIDYDVTDRLTASADISYSKTERTEEQFLIRTQSGPRFLTAWERESSDAGSFTIEDADVRDHSLFIDQYRARIDNDLDRTNTVTAGRLDFNYDLGDGLIKSIDLGGRYSSQEYYSLSGGRTEFTIRDDRGQDGRRTRDADDDADEAIIQAEIDANNRTIANLNEACRVDFTEGDNFLSSLRETDLFTTLDGDGGSTSYNSFASFDTKCLVNGVGSYLGRNVSVPDLVPGNSTIDVTENTWAAYVQANYQTQVSDIPVRGKVGLRVVDTDVESIGLRSALSIDRTDPLALRLVENSNEQERVVGGGGYTELLPSFSFVADLADDKILRGGIFRGLSRADPQDMGFSRSFSSNSANDEEPIDNVDDLIAGANGSGNPDFKPLTSWNYDLSMEWYPNADSILAVGGYYKRFVGGFENVVSEETYLIDGVQTTAPITLLKTNDDTSNLFGVEITASHNFSYLPGLLSGFGTKVSYNYADSDFEFEDSNYGVRGFQDENGEFVQTNVGIIAPANIPGFSKHVASAQLYYQIGDLDLQGIYKYRSQYFQPYTSNGTRLRYIGDVGVFEARASYKINSNLRVSLEAINLFDEPKKQNFYTDDNLGEVNVYGPRVFMGLRAKF